MLLSPLLDAGECTDCPDKQPPAAVLDVSLGSYRGEQIAALPAALKGKQGVLRQTDRAGVFTESDERARRLPARLTDDKLISEFTKTN